MVDVCEFAVCEPNAQLVHRIDGDVAELGQRERHVGLGDGYSPCCLFPHLQIPKGAAHVRMDHPNPHGVREAVAATTHSPGCDHIAQPLADLNRSNGRLGYVPACQCQRLPGDGVACTPHQRRRPQHDSQRGGVANQCIGGAVEPLMVHPVGFGVQKCEEILQRLRSV